MAAIVAPSEGPPPRPPSPRQKQLIAEAILAEDPSGRRKLLARLIDPRQWDFDHCPSRELAWWRISTLLGVPLTGPAHDAWVQRFDDRFSKERELLYHVQALYSAYSRSPRLEDRILAEQQLLNIDLGDADAIRRAANLPWPEYIRGQMIRPPGRPPGRGMCTADEYLIQLLRQAIPILQEAGIAMSAEELARKFASIMPGNSEPSTIRRLGRAIRRARLRN